MRLKLSLLLALIFISQLQYAQQTVNVRIVDIGAGLCSITEISGPDGTAYMIYDAGTEFPYTSQGCLEGIKKIVGDKAIDLMIISHSDADHLADADDILKEFVVKKVIRTGAVRGSEQWKNFNNAVKKEVEQGCSERNLANEPLNPGEKIQLAGAELTLVAGWNKWIPTENFDTGEERNVISIVVRLAYDDKSVLFTGDTIGRRKRDNDEACKNAEEFMVANMKNVPIRSNVMIAPHHGGNNGSSSCFISAVFGDQEELIVPRFVVFPSGHLHGHPASGVVERYLDVGGLTDNFIFRTDRGDDESSRFHHDDGSGCRDAVGDDTIDISWTKGGNLTVKYISDQNKCVEVDD